MQRTDRIYVDKKIVESALSCTKRIIGQNGARATGTPACLSAAEDFANQFRAHCNEVDLEDFCHHPDSLLLMGKIAAVSFIFVAVFLNIGGSFFVPACILSLLTLIYLCNHFFAFGSLFDGLFGKAPGKNVVATVEPEGPVCQQILIVAHIDSAHVFGYLTKFKQFAGIRLLLAILSYLFVATLAVLGAISFVIPFTLDLATAIRIGTILSALFLLPLYAFISGKTSPGAGDNLIGCTISLELAGFFCARAKQGSPLSNTRLVFLCADGEEIGLKGSAAFVKKHKDELKSIKISVVNLDSLYTLSDLSILKSDTHGFVRLSKKLVKSLGDLSEELGYRIRLREFPFGGGGTDAASFAKAGLEAVSIVAMPTSLFSVQNVYHTLEDTPDRIEPEVVEAVCNIVANYILQEDVKQEE